ncbi:pyruvate carboxylase subunit B [Helicobacter cholecystus]|uniref:Pyruvate carboxylase subunit B n=1 Tax=Helicobacter cholecystus TaxID=45498 RepID=A0A3D8IWX0_9HELI|nr:pyruvate carboxylase subunit B [Helicobacter cholecystus]RDU69456.1 pyruvate carboxylase subunit B [Helicobacter cholecystus]VEJ24007.1 pyruvate carboxylase subunit B [Helicobacter cholecystus]
MKGIKITENSLRDGVQSLLATRVSTQDMLEVARIFEPIGFHSVEVWGGATYDACLRYLNEDPFERLKLFKEIFVKTPLQMLLRGQNLVGYRHYSDDVLKEFIALSTQGGIDIFRIFDALNDSSNLKLSIEEVRKNGAEAQGAICYTTSPVHHLKFFISYAKELVELGCQSLAIKDMAGLLRPYDAYELVKAIKEEVGVPLSVHIHATTGFAFGSMLKAIEAGADVLDLSNSALSGGTSHPCTQALVATLQGTQWDTGLSLEPMEEASKILREIRAKYSEFESSYNSVDTEILLSQIPGGMISNLASQLKEQNALERMPEVAKEIIAVREDFGYIPLVTPTSQIVGTQAVLNVLQNHRYKTLTTESKNLILGLYGKTPAPIKEELVQKVSNQGLPQKPQNELQKAQEESREFAQSRTDVISYALFGDVAKNFLKGERKPIVPSPKTNLGHHFQAKLLRQDYKIEILEVQSTQEGESVKLRIDDEEKEVFFSASNPKSGEYEENEKAIYSPMGGTLSKIFVKEGDKITKDTVLGVVEAMKMENEILSHQEGEIAQVCVESGSNIQSSTILFLLK